MQLHASCTGAAEGGFQSSKNVRFDTYQNYIRHMCYVFSGPAQGPACSCMHRAPVLQRAGFRSCKNVRLDTYQKYVRHTCFRVLQRAPLGHLPKCVRHLRYMFVGPAEGPSRSCMHHRAWVLHRAPLGHDRICWPHMLHMCRFCRRPVGVRQRAPHNYHIQSPQVLHVFASHTGPSLQSLDGIVASHAFLDP